MATENTETAAKDPASPAVTAYTPPKGSRSAHHFAYGGGFDYEAVTDWIVLRKDEKPQAEVFYTAYLAKDRGERPLTFVFNGGPGASSVYLHLGAMGPRIVNFGPEGQTPPPPHRLVDNPYSWLQFTDLVFIDPVGTGFSRMVSEDQKGAAAPAAAGSANAGADSGSKGKAEVEYWGIQRDLESIGEFCRRFLSQYHRWENPVYVAGESYGGFRAARLAKLLQKDYGISLSGVIIISPALEFALLDSSDYDVLKWVDSFPTMAAAAAVHNLARCRKPQESLADYALRAGDFALYELLPVLAAGDLCPLIRRNKVLSLAADFVGLPKAELIRKNGRIDIVWFAKNLLRQDGLVAGLYDASATVKDPYPDRQEWNSPDPTLHVPERLFAAGINSLLRHSFGLETTREYALLSNEVNNSWKVDIKRHALESQIGATDDLRYGMSLNPHMKVVISHGYFDLVTPFFTANRLANLMKLDDERKRQLRVKHYAGGHMYYTWQRSREEFYRDMQALYTEA